MSTYARTPAGHDGLAPLERWAMLYLALPVVVFCAAWFTPLIGFGCAAAVVLGLASRDKRDWVVARSSKSVGLSLMFVCILLALSWAAFGGAGHWFYANADDWVGRDAILRDMVVERWPVKVNDPSVDGAQFWYRGPLAYYMLPAALGKLFGVGAADFFLYLWTATGTALFLALALERIQGLPKRLMAFAVIVLFSGADAIGVWIQGDKTPMISNMHLEWWARSYQFSSNSTLLFWVPNHALPGWIAGAWLMRQWGRVGSTRLSVFFCATPTPWSPMVALGLAVMAVLNAIFGSKLSTASKILAAASWPNWCGLFLGLVCSAYITADASTIPQGNGLNVPSDKVLGSAWVHAFVFWALEAGLLTLAVCTRQNKGVLLACTALFAMCLSYSFGAGNDWAMRGSIVALTMLCLLIVNQLIGEDGAIGKGVLDRLRAGVLVTLLAVGAITPLHEFARALTRFQWLPNQQLTLIAHAGSAASYAHYFSRVENPVLRLLMRD